MIDLDHCAAVFSEYIEGILRIAVDMHGTKDEPGSGRTLEVISPLGLIARPMDPDTDPSTQMVIGAGCLLAEQGSQAWAFPTTDPRFVASVPELQKGGTALYNATGAWFRLDGDGVAQLYVKQDETSAHSLTIDPELNMIQFCHALGQNFSMNEDGGTLTCSPNGKVWVKVTDDGIVLNGPVTIMGSCIVGNPTTAVPVAITAVPGTVSTVLSASPVPTPPTP